MDFLSAGAFCGKRMICPAMRKLLWLLALLTVVCGCKSGSSHLRITLVSDRPWPIGEARDCSGLDGQWMEAHCFPPENLGAKKYKYLVDAEFDRPPHFDKEQWAYDITCRLDSFDRATCQQNTRRNS